MATAQTSKILVFKKQKGKIMPKQTKVKQIGSGLDLICLFLLIIVIANTVFNWLKPLASIGISFLLFIVAMINLAITFKKPKSKK